MKALVSDTHNKGKQSIITGYNHIDSVDECAPAISIGYVFLQLRYVIVGGKLVPLGGGGPCGIGDRILMPRFCSSIPQHRTCCLGSTVARYHRPFEARSSNSTRRETYRQLAACSSAAHGGWFAPLSFPPGSPAPLAPVSEPLRGIRPRRTQQPRCRRQ